MVIDVPRHHTRGARGFAAPLGELSAAPEPAGKARSKEKMAREVRRPFLRARRPDGSRVPEPAGAESGVQYETETAAE